MFGIVSDDCIATCSDGDGSEVLLRVYYLITLSPVNINSLLSLRESEAFFLKPLRTDRTRNLPRR